MHHKRPDWTLATEALSSFQFLRNAVEPENQSLPVSRLISNHIDNENIQPLNAGTVIAFAYMVIVYPLERHTFGIPKTISFGAFTEAIPSKNSKMLVTNLRNALSHGDFQVTNSDIHFHHNDWKATISIEDMSQFLERLLPCFMAQHYIGWSHKKDNK